jgi:predicted small lipoprotein YifL
MTKFTVVVAALILLAGCGQKPTPVAKAAKDPKIAAVEDRISKTTGEGKQVIEKVQSMKPEVNEQLSAKTLAEMAEHYAKDMGAYNLTPIGWEAAKKKSLPGEKSGRWKVAFDYFDYKQQLLIAEWEYNADTNKLYPFEKDNAPGFWEGAAPGKKGKK